MAAKQSPNGQLVVTVKSWRLRQLDSFKAHCKLCNIPLRPRDIRFLKFEDELVFCRKCWDKDIKPKYLELNSIASSAAMDMLGCIYGLIYHSDLLRNDEDFAEVGKYVVSVMKGYVDRLLEKGYDPDAIMHWWPLSMLQRLTGLSLPRTWEGKTFAAAAIHEIANVCRNNSLILYMTGYSEVWKDSFRGAPAASALRREPLRKAQPEELAELLRQASR